MFEILTVIFGITSFSLFLVANKLQKDNAILAQAIIEQTANKIASKLDDEEEIMKESFLKFVSDSREWAFEYIENVQKQIKDFIDVADKQFSFFDSYGVLSEGHLYYENMKTISEEYKKLKALLPEEDNK
jgi:hypothetical protein